MALLLLNFGKRLQDQGDAPRKRTALTSLATEQTLRTPTIASASMQDLRNVRLSRSSCISTVADVATEHIQLESKFEMLQDSGASSADVETASLDDLVSELDLKPEESAVVLCSAAQT